MFYFILGLFLILNTKAIASNSDWEINHEMGFDIREFHKQEAYSNQKNTYSSYFKTEFFFTISDNINFISEPYYRYDHNDKNRTLFDFKVNKFTYFGENYEIKLGVDEVFWGVTESKNLVNIINTNDNAAGDLKEKLGQPLLAYTIFSEQVGYIDFYFLPVSVKSAQIGQEGRLRFSNPTENNGHIYSGGAGEKIPSWAFKWEKNISIFDFSFQGFRGNSRENSITPILEGASLKYFPGYERISQLGTYFQLVSGPIIYKIEAIKKNGQKNAKNIRKNFFSYTLGIEYLYNRLFEKKWDINTFIEYSNDDRNNDSLDILQNDLFIATKLIFNNIQGAELLASTTFDLDGGGNTALAEFSSRLSENMRVTALYQAYWSTNNKDILYSFRRDNHFGLKLVKYF